MVLKKKKKGSVIFQSNFFNYNVLKLTEKL